MSSEPTKDLVPENNVTTTDVSNLEEVIRYKQSDDMYVHGRKQSLRARYMHGFIFLATNLLAWFFRDYGAKFLIPLQNLRMCKNDPDKCFHAGGVLHVSFGCFIFFFIMFTTTTGAHKLHEFRNTWHSSWWTLKLIIYFVSLIVPFIIPKSFILIYGEVARVGAGIFRLLQLISMLEFIAWCNSKWMPHPRSKKCDFIGLILSTISFIASYGGLSFIASYGGLIMIYFFYSPNSKCAFNIFTITWAAILVKVLMGVSLHSKVNEGLLSSGIIDNDNNMDDKEKKDKSGSDQNSEKEYKPQESTPRIRREKRRQSYSTGTPAVSTSPSAAAGSIRVSSSTCEYGTSVSPGIWVNRVT